MCATLVHGPVYAELHLKLRDFADLARIETRDLAAADTVFRHSCLYALPHLRKICLLNEAYGPSLLVIHASLNTSFYVVRRE